LQLAPRVLQSLLEIDVNFSSLFQALGGIYLDDALVWGVALLAGIVGLVAVANAIDMLFFDTESADAG